MNPWSFVVLALGIALVIVAYRGTEDNVASALSGKSVGNNTLSTSTQASTANATTSPNWSVV